ncbi:MAG TPA: hypothetical protein DEA96_02495, partial [Leptospiraceae bacterium]|nr:hypothetical protein [Leptospiraceae bacterium]
MAKHIPVIGLAGRRNAGKSSLFNALLGKNRALTHETPGLTRDVLRGEMNRYGMRFQVLDLPGLDLEPEHGLDDAILARARENLNSVDLVVYLMEPPAAAPFDLDFIQWLRKENRPLILAVNKIDAPEKESDIYGFYEDGLDPLPVSAASKYHLKDLCEAIKASLEERDIRVPPAILRDPDLVNRLPPWKRKKASKDQMDDGRIESEQSDPDQGLSGSEGAAHEDEEPEFLEIEIGDEAEGDDARDAHDLETEASSDSPATGLQSILTEEEIEDLWKNRQRNKEIRSTTISDDRLSDLRISLVGKQNAGKSSLFNRLVDEEMSLVSDIAGTTRDTLDTVFKYHGKSIRIIDTAGLKKRGAVKNATDFYSMRRSLRAMQDSEIVIHLIDGLKGISDYDKKIQAMIARFARPCILVINKWDAVPDKDHK